MEIMRALSALSIVLSVVGFWVYKSRHMLALTPCVAPLALCVLHLYCAYWIFFKSVSFGELLSAFAMAQIASRSVHSVFNRIDLAIVQRLRDRTAHRMFGSDPKASFALYLRPFYTTDRFSFYGLSTRWGGVDLESVISDACRPWGPLIGLGRKGDAVGSGKLYTPDEDWIEKFIKLADKASVIVVVPGVGEGSLFEIKWIIYHALLAKTTFLMPPSTLLRRPVSRHLAITSAENFNDQYDATNWAAISTCLKPLGILLPAYDPEGGVIQFYGNQGHCSQHGLGRDVRSIKRVLRERLAPTSATRR